MSKIKEYKWVKGPKPNVHMYEDQATEWISKGLLEEVTETKKEDREPKEKKKKKNKKNK